MYFFDRLTHFDLSLITGDEVTIMLIGYVIVFLVLFSLYIVFKNVPKLLHAFLGLQKSIKNRDKKEEKKIAAARTEVKTDDEPITGAVNAAITTAIHLYINDNYHDDEDAILTIQKVSRRYSPWSSKIYSVTNYRR